MKRFDVLDKNASVFGHFFLEASAGTGKTFAIEHIVVRALLEAKTPLSIDQILVVTFTRAATRELKTRVKSTLVKTLLILQRGQGGPDYLSPIFLEGEAAIYSAKRKIEEALYCFDKASIFTLHGFCHRSLSDCAFETGSFFDMPSADTLSHREKMMLVVEDFLRVGLKEDLYSPAQVSALLKKFSGSAYSLARSVCDVMERNIVIAYEPPFSHFLQQIKKIVEEIREKSRITSASATEDLEMLLPLYKKAQPYHIKQAQTLFSAIEKGHICSELFDEMLLEKEYFLKVLSKDNLKKGKDPQQLKLSYPLLWTALVERLYPLMQRAIDSSALLLRLANDCMTLWKGSSYYHESLCPDDLLKKMASALSMPEFLKKISEKYHLAIIDEFQDTDPIQWEIFKTLFVSATPTKTIFLVGDPKQSIYGFRNADVYTYMEALRTLGTEKRLFLDTNFRSSSTLVKALNTLFTCNISPGWMQLPSSKQALEVRAVGSKDPLPSELGPQQRQSIHFFIAEGSMGRSRRWPSEDIEESQLFPFIAEEITRLKKNEGYRLGQIAILVRDRFQASRLELFMKRYNISLSIRRPIDLKGSLAYLALYDLICAVIRPDDVSALKKVLGGALVGLSATELTGGMELDVLQQAKIYFERARSQISTYGWGAFFNHFLMSKWKASKDCVEEDLLKRADSSLYFEIRQLLQLIQHADEGAMFCLEAFASFFASLSLLPPEEEILKVALETEEDEVVVMTIHASKGLEFDVVFALGLVTRSGVMDDVVTIRNESQQQQLVLWRGDDPSCSMACMESDAEKMRHLYVALTRAKDRVYIPIAIDADKKNVPLFSASSIELLCQSFGCKHFDLLQAYSHIPLMSVQQITQHIDSLSSIASIGYSILSSADKGSSAFLLSETMKQLRYAPYKEIYYPKKSIFSFSSLHEDSGGSVAKAPPSKDSMDILPLGADTGTLLHAIMEDVFEDGLHSLLDAEGLKRCVEKKIKNSHLYPYGSAVEMMIKQSLQSPIQFEDKIFSLCDIRRENLFLEMEFAYEAHGNRMKGFIDALCLFQGKYYIFDWKSNYLGPSIEDYTLENIKAAMHDSSYFLQASIYAEALRRYLALIEKKSFSELFGGAVYLFMRGAKAYTFMPDLSLQDRASVKEGL